MYQLNEKVANLFRSTRNCAFSTNGEYPNTIIVMFRELRDDGVIVLYDVFMNHTLENLARDPHASLVINEGLEGYQIKGTARWTDDPALVAAGNAMTSKANLKTKGAVLFTPETAEVLTPGPDVGKVL